MLYIAIPAHNEVETIGVLLWRLRSVLAEFPRDFAVVVYDDASSDNTAEVLESYQKVLPLTIVRGERQVGYASAVDRLLRHVVSLTRHPRRDAVLLLQGDFTDPPGLVPEFARRFEGGADLVVGERRALADAPVSVNRLFRYAGWSMRWLVQLDGVRDITSSMRLMRIAAVRDLMHERGESALLEGDSWTANADLLLRLAPHARRIETVPVESTYGVRVRETRREAMRDAVAALKWAWHARKRRVKMLVQQDTDRTRGEPRLALAGSDDKPQRRDEQRRDERTRRNGRDTREGREKREGRDGRDGTRRNARDTTRDSRRKTEQVAPVPATPARTSAVPGVDATDAESAEQKSRRKKRRRRTRNGRERATDANTNANTNGEASSSPDATISSSDVTYAADTDTRIPRERASNHIAGERVTRDAIGDDVDDTTEHDATDGGESRERRRKRRRRKRRTRDSYDAAEQRSDSDGETESTPSPYADDASDTTDNGAVDDGGEAHSASDELERRKRRARRGRRGGRRARRGERGAPDGESTGESSGESTGESSGSDATGDPNPPPRERRDDQGGGDNA